MRYRLLGRSGLRVSQVVLGTMTFGDDWGWGADAITSRAMFERFAEAGGNFVDTACNYTDGSSERIIGACLGRDRDRFVVASKYTLTIDGSDRRGSSRRQSPWPSSTGGRRRSRCRRPTRRSVATSSATCCRWPTAWGCPRSHGACWRAAC